MELQDFEVILAPTEAAEVQMAKQRPLVGLTRLLLDELTDEKEHTTMLNNAKPLSAELLLREEYLFFEITHLDHDVVLSKANVENQVKAIESQIVTKIVRCRGSKTKDILISRYRLIHLMF